MRGGVLLSAALWLAFVERSANADGPALSIRGPREHEVHAELGRTLVALDLRPASGVVDVDLAELSPQALRYQVRVKRSNGMVERIGVARPDELGARVSSLVLLGLLARAPDARPRVALVVDGDRPPTNAVVVWKAALQQRGYAVISDAEVSLARSTLKKGAEPEVALAQMLGVAVIGVQLRNHGSSVAVQASVFDDEARRGALLEVAADELEAQVSLLFDGLPVVLRRKK
jgi:hypothetical protein